MFETACWLDLRPYQESHLLKSQWLLQEDHILFHSIYKLGLNGLWTRPWEQNIPFNRLYHILIHPLISLPFSLMFPLLSKRSQGGATAAPRWTPAQVEHEFSAQKDLACVCCHRTNLFWETALNHYYPWPWHLIESPANLKTPLHSKMDSNVHFFNPLFI